MHRSRWITRRSAVVVPIVVVLLALVVWATRPSPLYEWLISEGFSHETPVAVFSDWGDGRLAPITPVGFLTLFSVAELGVLFALMAALAVLFVLLPAQWRVQRIRSWLNRPVTTFRLPRFAVRVWVAMVLIAALGLYIGWEIAAWKNWRLSDRYRRLAAVCASDLADCRLKLKEVEKALEGFGSRPLVLPDNTLTPVAQAAIRNYQRDSYRDGAVALTARCAALGDLKQKYERAAANPSQTIEPVLTIPERRGGVNADFRTWHDYVRSNVDYDALIERYPDLYWAHERKAWLLATSPDPSYRDGHRAVAEALRAAELTRWNDGHVLSTLAATYAEAGDFVNAVRWQERALERADESRPDLKRERDQLAFYKSGKPFRLAP